MSTACSDESRLDNDGHLWAIDKISSHSILIFVKLSYRRQSKAKADH